jgi:hypothetical protein
MPSNVSGDFSKFPLSIQKIFPMICGEACELRTAYDVYFYLFMAKEERTVTMGEKLGGVLGMFQSLLQDEIFLSIARLTDKDSRGQKNLSLWVLLDAIPHATGAGFEAKVRDTLDRIVKDANGLRTHRHKRLAHFDLGVSLSSATLPVVTFKELEDLRGQIESFLNMFYVEFAETSMLFDALSSRQITHPAEVTCYKALTYDLLEKEGAIPHNEWKKRAGN